MPIGHSRRDVLAGLSVAGAAGLVGARGSLAAKGPPETTTVRLPRAPNICAAPGYISEELLRAEGFTGIRYIPDPPIDAVARGDIDFELQTAAWVVSQLDAGAPVAGCEAAAGILAAFTAALAIDGGPAAPSVVQARDR